MGLRKKLVVWATVCIAATSILAFLLAGGGGVSCRSTPTEPSSVAPPSFSLSPRSPNDALRSHSSSDSSSKSPTATTTSSSSETSKGNVNSADWTVAAMDRALEAAAATGFALNASLVLDWHRARLSAYLHSATYARRRGELLRRLAAAEHRRGVVIAAGGKDGLANAAVTVRALRRRMGCASLPVEVVYFADADARAAPTLIRLIEDESAPPQAPVYVINGSDARYAAAAAAAFAVDDDVAPPAAAGDGSDDARGANKEQQPPPPVPLGFASKVFALVFVTRFADALLLDADSLPLACPSDALFESAAFRKHGNIFWPDFWRNAWVDPSIYKRFGAARPPWEEDEAKGGDFRLAESGQLMLDRARYIDVLPWLWLLNSPPAQAAIYKAMHGDKDTYRLAFLAASRARDYYQVRTPPRDAMAEAPGHAHKFHHLGVLQASPGDDGDAGGGAAPPAFFHRTSFNGKFFPYCARRLKGGGGGGGNSNGKEDSGGADYCRPQWATPPLTPAQAARALKPHIYAFDAADVDTERYKAACGAIGGDGGSDGSGGDGDSSSSSNAAELTAPEAGCDLGSGGSGSGNNGGGGGGGNGGNAKIVALPIARLGRGALAALEASFQEFRAVAGELAAAAAAA